ncbi:class D sortase, partial [Halomonas sp. THAF12]|uniref:class D sortase n=1 Tax=Halomonas sp. B23F22_10 TaxID=3459515 RepID=UPI00373F902D
DVLELEIPSIQVKEMVLPDTTLENLSIALTQIKADQKPGEGNFTIAGHRGYRANRHFRNLPKVKTGEEILLHQGDQTFVYEITDIKVIAPTKTEVLQDHKDQKEITLITCTMDGKDRVMVKGTLKQST